MEQQTKISTILDCFNLNILDSFEDINVLPGSLNKKITIGFIG